MRFGVVIFLVSLLIGLPTRAWAKEDQHRAQLQAAHTDAVASLLDQVRVERLSPDLIVGQFLQRSGGEERLRQAVERSAQQIGATRWPNPGTCQVQLEVSADEVARTLISIASDEPRKSPMPADAIARRLAQAWRQRTFAATGTSATPQAVEKMRPGPDHPLWLAVPEADRREAVKAAQRNAAGRAMDGLGDIPLGGGKTLSDALQVPEVRDAIQAWVAGRPVTNIEFRDNGELRLTVSAPGEELWPVLRDALAKQTQIAPPRDEAEWGRLHDEVVGRLRTAVGGRSSVTTQRPVATTHPPTRTIMPQQRPRWADEQLNADGTAGGGGDQLALIHSAKGEASKSLRTQIKALSLGDGRKLGDAASDPDVAAAIDRSLLRARVRKVDWGPNANSATVHMSLDLRHVWHELAQH
jgi:hypothetical protein